MSFTSRLLCEFDPQWQAMTRHEFIRTVADASIEPAQFHAWLQQDYLYVRGLINYVGLLIAKAPPALTLPLGQAVVVLNDELKLFRSEAAALGIGVEDIEPAPANFHYLQFLTATG